MARLNDNMEGAAAAAPSNPYEEPICSCRPLNPYEADACYRLAHGETTVTFCRRCHRWLARDSESGRYGRGLADYQRTVDDEMHGRGKDFFRSLGGHAAEIGND